MPALPVGYMAAKKHCARLWLEGHLVVGKVCLCGEASSPEQLLERLVARGVRCVLSGGRGASRVGDFEEAGPLEVVHPVMRHRLARNRLFGLLPFLQNLLVLGT